MIFLLLLGILSVGWFAFIATQFSGRSRAFLAVTALMFPGWCARPLLESMFRSEASILIDQLTGRGCQYQGFGTHSFNPITEFGIRNPDFACPIWAAQRLSTTHGLSDAERNAVMKAFDEALLKKPDSFDTGDGIIEYGKELRTARKAFHKMIGLRE